ncbi:MAG TPA: type II toxin-antitoxin system RelE/ParE family toxin [Beijerinckiaceae bacterium]|nr:type II toxin-antitoxin system RelE/ParE family toxin [Beijerinckiaceae bacterium]
MDEPAGVARKVVFRPAANADLARLYAYIRDQNGGPTVAIGYIRRIRAACERLGDFPDRGTRRDDLARGLPTLGFERRATIAFRVPRDSVQIVRVLYGGRNVDALLRQP